MLFLPTGRIEIRLGRPGGRSQSQFTDLNSARDELDGASINAPRLAVRVMMIGSTHRENMSKFLNYFDIFV